VRGQSIDERRLAGARRAGHAHDGGAAGMGVQARQQRPRRFRFLLDDREGTRHRPWLAALDLPREAVEIESRRGGANE
jgi:hypothetical protein